MYKLAFATLLLIATSLSGQTFNLDSGDTAPRPPTLDPPKQTSRAHAVVASRMRARVEYQTAVADFKRAFSAAEEARQRLSRLEPAGGPPDVLDCYFHPWHSGCQQIWNALEARRGPEWAAGVVHRFEPDLDEHAASEFHVGNIIAGWLAEKVLDYAWGVGKCMVKADGPDGRGLEGPEGLSKLGDCF